MVFTQIKHILVYYIYLPKYAAAMLEMWAWLLDTFFHRHQQVSFLKTAVFLPPLLKYVLPKPNLPHEPLDLGVNKRLPHFLAAWKGLGDNKDSRAFRKMFFRFISCAHLLLFFIAHLFFFFVDVC